MVDSRPRANSQGEPTPVPQIVGRGRTLSYKRNDEVSLSGVFVERNLLDEAAAVLGTKNPSETISSALRKALFTQRREWIVREDWTTLTQKVLEQMRALPL